MKTRVILCIGLLTLIILGGLNYLSAAERPLPTYAHTYADDIAKVPVIILIPCRDCKNVLFVSFPKIPSETCIKSIEASDVRLRNQKKLSTNKNEERKNDGADRNFSSY